MPEYGPLNLKMARTKRTASEMSAATALTTMKRKKASGKVTGKRINYVPINWIAKQNRPFRATIPINPFPPVYQPRSHGRLRHAHVDSGFE